MRAKHHCEAKDLCSSQACLLPFPAPTGGQIGGAGAPQATRVVIASKASLERACSRLKVADLTDAFALDQAAIFCIPRASCSGRVAKLNEARLDALNERKGGCQLAVGAEQRFQLALRRLVHPLDEQATAARRIRAPAVHSSGPLAMVRGAAAVLVLLQALRPVPLYFSLSCALATCKACAAGSDDLRSRGPTRNASQWCSVLASLLGRGGAAAVCAVLARSKPDAKLASLGKSPDRRLGASRWPTRAGRSRTHPQAGPSPSCSARVAALPHEWRVAA